MQARPSHSGAVHAGCVRPEDAARPALIEQHDAPRGAPKYGGPPILRVGCGVVTLLLLAAIVLLQLGPRVR